MSSIEEPKNELMMNGETMIKKLVYLGSTLFFVMVFPTSQARAEDYYFAIHAVYCSSEADVVELADARQGQVRQDLIMKKIADGRCSPPSETNKKMAYIVEKQSPARRTPYYCFREETSPEEYSSRYTCILGSFVTSVRQQIAYRNGEYMIKAKSGNFYNIECKEGGTVTIDKREDQFYRISNAFELSTLRSYVEPVPAGRDLDRAIRDGCKGTDYLTEQ